jgi:hypothetical protein
MTKNPVIFPAAAAGTGFTLIYVRPRAPAQWLARA